MPSAAVEITRHVDGGYLPSQGLNLGLPALRSPFPVLAVGRRQAVAAIRVLCLVRPPGRGLRPWQPPGLSLQPWMEQTGCGLATDGCREGLLAVNAECMEDTVAFASLGAGHRHQFIPHRMPRPRSTDLGTEGDFDLADY